MLTKESDQKTVYFFILTMQQHIHSQCCYVPAKIQTLSVAQATQLDLSQYDEIQMNFHAPIERNISKVYEQKITGSIVFAINLSANIKLI